MSTAFAGVATLSVGSIIIHRKSLLRSNHKEIQYLYDCYVHVYIPVYIRFFVYLRLCVYYDT